MARSGIQVQHFEIDPARPATLGDRLLGRLWPRAARPVKMEPNLLTQAHGLGRAIECRGLPGRDGRKYRLCAGAWRDCASSPGRSSAFNRGVLNFKHGYLRREISADAAAPHGHAAFRRGGVGADAHFLPSPGRRHLV
ncbi:MAG: hypothetical protein WDN28_28270 [Chthoniobacter sp.]